jgi:predicted enzyme related to lactoylglutathione lyase
MHRSRLVALVLDSQTPDLVAATAFWSAALGRPAKDDADPKTEKYTSLATRPGEIDVLLQRVDHPSRVHLDIETDDVEAEATRLEALGAKRIEKIKTWWVMEAPSGHRFCVVRPQHGDEMPGANEWK